MKYKYCGLVNPAPKQKHSNYLECFCLGFNKKLKYGGFEKMCVVGMYVCLAIMLVLLAKIFASENVIVYNGKKYNVTFDYVEGRCYCKLFGNVGRFIRWDNKYNIFGTVCEVM